MKTQTDWKYFAPAVAIAGLGIGAGLIDPAAVQNFVLGGRDLLVQRVGWSYILLDALFLAAVLVLAFGPWGRIRLGPEGQPPDFSSLTWFGMMFCTALAAGLVFFGAAEPLYHYSHPPPFSALEGRTQEAAGWAMVTSFLHWGFNAWCIYLILPIPLAYLVHKKGMPCRVSTTLQPILGEAAWGWFGKLVDGLCILVAVAGVAASLGYISLQLAGGLDYFYGFSVSVGTSMAIIAVLTLIVVISAASGLTRGIRILSNLNVRLALLLLVFVFLAGPSLYVVGLGLGSLGEYLLTLPLLTFRTSDGEGGLWLRQWTVLYYAWWLSWVPLVGLFYARVSRGRTIRELVVMALFAPTAASMLWFIVFGGSAIYYDLHGGAGLAGLISEHGMEYPIFGLLQQLPFTSLTIPLFLLLITVFFITSGDSASLVNSILSTGGNPDPPVAPRIFWGLMQGLTAALLLFMGGIEALQAASIMAGFLIMFLLVGILCSALILIRAERRAQRSGREEAAEEPVEVRQETG